MQKALFSLVAGALVGAPLFAQTPIEDNGPGLWSIDASGAKTPISTLGDFPELSNLGLNQTEVAQLCILPDQTMPGSYKGVATVTKLGASDFDFISFDWTPGTNPTITTDVDLLNGPADEFQGSLSWDLLSFVGDTGAGHPVGNGAAIIATRAAPNQQFVTHAVISGVPGGYIDPQLGRINGQDVIYWADPSGGIYVGDIDLNPTSPTWGSVTNAHAAVPAQTTIPQFNSVHSPTPCYDNSGNAIGLIFSIYVTGSGSDTYYVPAADMTPYVASQSLVSIQLHPYPTSVDGTAWNNNPAAVKGTFVYAHSGNYTDVRRIEAVTLSSATFSAANGGMVSNTVQLPMSVANDNCIAAINYGAQLLPTPFDPNAIPGFSGYGKLGLSAVVSLSVGPVSNQEVSVTWPMAAGTAANGQVLLAEALVFNVTAGNEVYLSNIAFVEAN